MKNLSSFVALCLCLSFAQDSGAKEDGNTIARPPLESNVYYQETDNGETEKRQGTVVEDLIGNWPRKNIREARIDIREENAVAPKDRSYDLAANAPNSDWTQFHATPKFFAWAAPDIRYQPLYFEDVALERYGQTCGLHLQPWKSSIHFFTSAVLSPLKMVHDRPFSCDYPLGFCRPGANVPTTRQLQILGHADH